MGRVVLVTGVSDLFAGRVARRLAEAGDAAGVDRVVGIGTVLPSEDLGPVKFVRADIRTPVVGKVIAVEDVDTVVHLDLRPSTAGRAAGKELNVIGTMQLLAACQRSAIVNKLVLGSSAAVYGSSPRDPALFSESTPARGGVKTGFPKDMVEVEGYARGFARRRPEVLITTLRLTQVLDREVRSPLGDYLRNPLLPAAIGYDPRLQFLHVDDAYAVITLAVAHDRPGTFNVAGDGVMLLSQAARRLGHPILPLPAIGFAAGARRIIRTLGSDIPPDLHRLLTFGRAVEITALRDIFGYEPGYTTEQVLEEFRRSTRPGLMSNWAGAR